MYSQEESIKCAILCRPVTDSSTNELLQIHSHGGNFSLQLGNKCITPHSLYADRAIPIENLCKFSLMIQLFLKRQLTNRYPPFHVAAENEIKPLLHAILRGESAAIITAGATGSGKSFFIGTGKWNPKSAAQYVGANLWKLAEEQGATALDVKLSFLEIISEGGNSKERVYDLFTDADRNQKRPSLPSTRSPWEVCTWVKINDKALLLSEIKKGAKRRTTDSNGINDTSSRSHAIITVKLQYTNKNDSTVSAKLLLADLAGNEDTCAAEKGYTRVPKDQSRNIPSTTPVKNITRAQGRGINVGHFHLLRLITALASGNQPTSDLFKNSKLTELLEPALGGRNIGIMSNGCRTLMVGCISHLAVDAERSMHTLHLIEAAGAVKIKVAADIMLSTSRQNELDILTQKLKHANEQLREMEMNEARQAEKVQGLETQLAMQAAEKLRASGDRSLQPLPASINDAVLPFHDKDGTTSVAEEIIDLTMEEPDNDNNASEAALGERTPGFENTPSFQVPVASRPPPRSRQKTSTPQSKSITKRRLQQPGVSCFGEIERIVLSSCKKRQRQVPHDLSERYVERNPHWKGGQQLLAKRKENTMKRAMSK